ncbi:MAG TPA: PilT/PilU family type 4a pilus ATPase [Candidatus Omnitrophota bacterium]|nr:PilT/PilU family type 4a pilus ATPase [Candidatus Omnitrophota bacterium]
MESRTFFRDCLAELVEKDGTDLHLKAGEAPRIRYQKQLLPISEATPSNTFLGELIDSFLSEYQKRKFETLRAIDFSFSLDSLGRFRANAFYQKGELAMVVRCLKSNIPAFKDLGLPEILNRLTLEERGLILIAGPVGSGKSTTIAAMVNYINDNRKASLITLEDPIEYLYKDHLAFISQREIGLDTDSFLHALRYMVRQDPDVIVIGEIRDPETLQAALAAAETGRLVISSVHGKNVQQTFERILGLYPREAHEKVLTELSYNLKGLVSQRLLRSSDRAKLVPACEVLLASPAASKVLREGLLGKLNQVMQNSRDEGMQSMNQSLLQLFQEGQITKEDALAASDNPQELEMNMKGIFLDEARGRILDE